MHRIYSAARTHFGCQPVSARAGAVRMISTLRCPRTVTISREQGEAWRVVGRGSGASTWADLTGG